MDRQIHAREAELVEMMLKDRGLLFNEHNRVCGLDQEVDIRKPTDRDRVREILLKEFGVEYWPLLAKFGQVRRPPVRH